MRELASEYKLRGYSKQLAWDQFIIDRGLKPEMNASDFYRIFDNATPAPISKPVDIDFTPNYFDGLLRKACQITVRDDGVFEIIWQDGHTGSNPPNSPPDATRFKPITVDEKTIASIR